MAGTTVYAPNGATFNCDTPERLEHYLKAGWSKRPIKKAKTEPPNAEPDKSKANAEPDKSKANAEPDKSKANAEPDKSKANEEE